MHATSTLHARRRGSHHSTVTQTPARPGAASPPARATPPMSLPRTTRTGAAAVAVAVLIAAQFVALGIARPLLRPDPYSDFATFYSAAQCFRTGTDAYDPAALRAAGTFPGWVGRYFYPPPFAAVAIRPLAALPFTVARRLWVGIEIVAFVAAAWWAATLATPLPAGARAVVVIALALAFSPIFLDLRLGSVSGILAACAVLGLRARARAQPMRAGAWLAVAVMIKLAPVWLLLYCAARREWRLVAAAASTGVAIAIASLPWTGVAAWASWFGSAVPVLMRESFAWFTNQSLDALFWRLFVPNPDTTPWIASPLTYRVLTLAATACIVVVVARAVRRAGVTGSDDETFAATVILAASPLVARVAWEYLFVLTLPAFLAWAGRAARGAAGRGSLVAVALAWWLCAAPFAYEVTPPRRGVGLLAVAPRTYGTVLLIAVSAAALARRRRLPAEPR